MTIIAVTTAAPIRPKAVSDGVEDVVAEAWSVFGEVQNLVKLGIEVEVTVRPGEILADLVVRKEAAHLLPALVKELENSGITRTKTGFRVAGTMCQGNVSLRIIIDSSQITVEQIEALVAAVDVDFDAYAGGDEYTEWAA
ncbi:hypothetical protein NX794_33220 [Streptomyces sp. LP11]|uniref:Uncharacterized protein n=1 Tax=Streptomyces pyxinicus TaxID=2970331 RepID=A0ABT2BBZ7_9ACTN|nr:hypothetical protein [Streptomyces sp. LP11]MCS0606034.1 hypothetical protein [Streptomyces sp. LP11]